MTTTAPLESNLAEIFEKQAPKMPDGGKKFFVTIAPWAALIGGIWTLLSVLTLWRWAHEVNSLANFAHDLCTSYGAAGDCSNVGAGRLNVWIWLSLLFLAVEGVIYLLAFPGLRARKKEGWNYLYYGALISVAYSIIELFNGYGGAGSFILGLIGAAIGFWIIFQIRSSYTATHKTSKARP